MTILILEDERLAAEGLRALLHRYDPTYWVADILESVEDAVQWLRQNAEPDLILMDIHLADGLCFGIFSQLEVQCPIIFTTAHAEHAVQAFRVNSVDYLLKPVSYQSLSQAMEKFQGRSREATWAVSEAVRHVTHLLQQPQHRYKARFLVKFGDRLQYKNVQEISYFYADGKVVYLVTHENKRFIVEYTLEELEDRLDPEMFHRINRKVIVQLEAVRDVRVYTNSRLRLSLWPSPEGEVVVSREKVPAFKAWLDR